MRADDRPVTPSASWDGAAEPVLEHAVPARSARRDDARDRRAASRRAQARREAVDAFLADAHVPDRRGPDDHVRVARRGRGRAPPALGFGLPVVAAAHARRRAPTSGTSRSSSRPARASSTSSRSSATATASGSRIRSTRTARAIRSARTRSLHGEGYEVPELDPARSRRAARASLEPFWIDSKAFGAPRLRRSTCPRASGARRQLPAARRPRRPRLPALRVAEDGPRQPDPPPRDPRHDRRVHQTRPIACASTPTTSATRSSSPRSSSRDLERLLPARSTQPQSRCLMGASFGAVAVALDRVPLPRRSAAGCCCSRARSRSPTSATATAAARSSIRSSSS